MKKLFAKKEVVKKEVVEFKELNDEQLDKIVGGDRRDPRGMIGIGKNYLVRRFYHYESG
ncbi:bacteriocin [Streptococcus anginosus]|uniref:bacteriocin n=1 Tax=Streptococcus anginosus TaxID=1328 RepID=UPI00189B16D2|nr:bacteriocin [Streptococcus anginosus]MDB8661820.1 bacteriocin [Streptococcus anginosus]